MNHEAIREFFKLHHIFSPAAFLLSVQGIMNYNELKKIFEKYKDKLVPLSSVAGSTPYSAQYLSLRARQGKLWAIKFNRDWLTTHEAVGEYIRKQRLSHTKALTRFTKSSKK